MNVGEAYTVQMGASAWKELLALVPDVQVRILNALAALETNPHRAPNTRKLAGTEDLWRLRVGDYRIIYTIYDEVLVVQTVRIGHRREVYR